MTSNIRIYRIVLGLEHDYERISHNLKNRSCTYIYHRYLNIQRAVL